MNNKYPNIKLILILLVSLIGMSCFSQSLPENEVASAINKLGLKKCFIYKNSNGIGEPYYTLSFDEKGRNTKRVKDTDVDLYTYDENGRLLNRSFCLNGDTIWCVEHEFLYDTTGLLQKQIHINMPSNESPVDSTVYRYQGGLLVQKLFYEQGTVKFDTRSSTRNNEEGRTVIDSCFQENKLLDVDTYKYNLSGDLIYRRNRHWHGGPLFTTHFEYDKQHREIAYNYYTGPDASKMESVKTYYRDNGLVERVETPDFTLYYIYE